VLTPPVEEPDEDEAEVDIVRWLSEARGDPSAGRRGNAADVSS
jgi:hypothetical protein